MTVKFNIKQVAISKGIKNANQLKEKANLYPSHARRIWDGEMQKISLELIDKLCVALECEPGDLFKRTSRK